MAKHSFEANANRPAQPAAKQDPAKAPRPQSRPAQKQQAEEPEYDYDRSVKLANRGCLVATAVVFLVFAAAALWAFTYVNNDISGKNATAADTVVVKIGSGYGATTIGNILEEEGLIKHSTVFRLYVRFNDSGKGFKQGRFLLEPGMSYKEMLAIMSEEPPPREVTKVTIPEGSTVIQFATIYERNGLCSAQEFIEVANDIDRFSDIEFFKYIDFDPNTFMKAEGYLAPDTYEVWVDEEPEYYVRMLYEHFDKILKTEYEGTGQNVYDRMEEQNLTLREVITLASLVEEEAGLPENQPGVAGVFWNRLTKDLGNSGMARRTLGSDVTLRYIMDWVSRDYGHTGADFDGMTLAASKEILVNEMPHDVFYGYYTADNDEFSREGLPIGPISCPSKTAIWASLWPEQSNYFFFVTDAYGEYYYAKTYSEHLGKVATAENQTAKKKQEDAIAAENEANNEGDEGAGED